VGGRATPVTAINRGAGERYHSFPSFLPDGRHFLYAASNVDSEKSMLYVADVDSKDDSKTRRLVMAANSNAVYAPPPKIDNRSAKEGYLLFQRDQTLMAQPFDAESLRIMGDSVPIANRVDITTRMGSVFGGAFSVSQNLGEDSVLTYVTGGVGVSRQLNWFNRSGKLLGALSAPEDPRSGGDHVSILIREGRSCSPSPSGVHGCGSNDFIPAGARRALYAGDGGSGARHVEAGLCEKQ